MGKNRHVQKKNREDSDDHLRQNFSFFKKEKVYKETTKSGNTITTKKSIILKRKQSHEPHDDESKHSHTVISKKTKIIKKLTVRKPQHHVSGEEDKVSSESSREFVPTYDEKFKYQENKTFFRKRDSSSSASSSSSTDESLDSPNSTYDLLIDRITSRPLFNILHKHLLQFDPKKRERIKQQFDVLGNYSENPERYFEQTEASSECATIFLAHYFANPKNRSICIEDHTSKINSKIWKAKSNSNTTCGFPSCISFVTATVLEKKCCFVVSSVLVPAHTITTACADINSKEISEYEFVPIHIPRQNSRARIDMNTLISKLSLRLGKYGYKQTRYCAELYALIIVKDLYKKYGNHVFIEGIENIIFYPYEKNKQYGYKADPGSDESFVRPTLLNDKIIDIGNNMYVSSIPCCSNCQIGKQASLLIMRDAQIYGENEISRLNHLLDGKFLDDSTIPGLYPLNDLSTIAVRAFEESCDSEYKNTLDRVQRVLLWRNAEAAVWINEHDHSLPCKSVVSENLTSTVETELNQSEKLRFP